MKKTLILIVFLFSVIGYSQNHKVTMVSHKSMTTTQRDAYTVPSGEYPEIYNTTTGQKECWNGTVWAACGGGSSHDPVSVLDSAEIDFTLSTQQITASLIAGSVDVLKLDAGVQASLALADSALQTEVDGSVTNEIQTIDVSQLTGTNLELSLSSDGEATKVIDLSSLQDGTGTDDQTAAEVPFTPNGSIAATNVQAAIQEVRDEAGGGSGANPNITVANSLTDITNAGASAIVDIQGTINTSGNYTPPLGQKWIFSTGEIVVQANDTVFGNTTELIFYDKTKGIDAFNGVIAGTWSAPEKFTANNLGARSTGTEIFNGASTTLGSTTVTSATANFTANDVGKWVAIVGAGRLQDVPFNTLVGSFTNGETITFSGGATATITTYTETAPTGTIVATITSGVFPLETETITGGTSGATAVVANNITERPYVHVSTIASVTNSTTIVLADAALNTATNTTMVYGWNDRNAIENAQFIRNQLAGDLEFLAGNDYYFDVIQANPSIQQVPYGFVIGNDTDGVFWEVNGRLQAFPHETQDSKSIAIYRTNGSGIKGTGKIWGDYRYHKEENGRGEGNHAVYIATLANNTRLTGSIDCSYWYGDAIYGSGDTQFMNQIDGTNFVDGSTESAIAQGSIDQDGNINVSDTESYYTPTLLTLEGFQFNNITSRGLQKFVHLTGASYGGWEGMRTPYFKIAFYDSSNAFLFITNYITWFDKVPIPEGATQARVTFITPLDPANIQLNLRPDLNPDGLVMEGWTLTNCGRQGISNGPSNAIFKDMFINHIGGLNAGPGYGIDYEDGGRIKKNITFENITFQNNWGDIILKGCENVVIKNTWHKASTISTNNSTYANVETGISSLFGRNVLVDGSHLFQKNLSLDRQDKVRNLTMKGGTLSFTANSNDIQGSEFWNVYLAHAPDASRDRLNHPTTIKNNRFNYNIRKLGYWFYNVNNAAIFEDNIFKFNDVGDWNFAAESTDAYMVAGEGGYDSFFLDQAQTTDFGGYSRNNTYEGMLPSVATRDYSSGNNRPVLSNTIDQTYEMPVEFTYGLPKSYTHKNMQIYGWLEYDFNQYEASIISATPTISHIGGKLHLRSADGYAWTNNGSNLLATEARNVNLYFEDFEFIIEQAFTRTDVSQKLMDINHLGTTVFKNCKFALKGMPAYVMDLTQTGNFGANLGAVTFINPDLDFDDDGTDDMSIVLRAQDRIIYTEIGDDNSFSKFTTKASPTTSDFLLVEDAADGGKVKKVAFPSGGSESTTVTDTAEIDLTLTGVDITASLITGSIDETKLDVSTNASLDLADTASQPGDNISGFTNDSGYITSQTDDQTAAEVTSIDTSFDVIQGTNVQDNLNSIDNYLLDARATSLRGGGALTDLGSGVVRIASGEGVILDNATPLTPTFTPVSWSQTDIDLSGQADGVQNYIYVNSLGTVTFTTTAPSHVEYRDAIWLHRVVVRSGVVSGNLPIPQISQQYAANLWDLWQGIGLFKHDYDFTLSGNGAGGMNISAGGIYAPGANYYINTKSPNEVEIASQTPSTFKLALRDNTQTGDLTVFDVTNYDNAGVLTTMNNNQWGIYTVFMFSNGNVRILRPQTQYSTLILANEALQLGQYAPVTPSNFEDALRLGWIIFEKGDTNLTNADFITANRFGGIGGSISSVGIGYLARTNNLSDLTNSTQALTNLGFTATATELNYTDGVTSNIQTQLDAKISNATHTGQITGATTLTLDKTAISDQTAVTAASTDYVLIGDTSDTNNLKKALVSDLIGGGISNVVEDLTPQLGGSLDVGANQIFSNGSITIGIDDNSTGASEIFKIQGLNGVLLNIDNDTGVVSLPDVYGSGTVTGTPSYNASFDSSGNIIETPITESIQIACSDLITDITTGTAKAYFRMPYAMTVTDVRCSLFDAGTSTGLTVDINEAGVSILSTLLTTDATEETSETATTAAVISDSSLADDAKITIDFDAVPTAGKGVIVTLIGTRL